MRNTLTKALFVTVTVETALLVTVSLMYKNRMSVSDTFEEMTLYLGDVISRNDVALNEYDVLALNAIGQKHNVVFFDDDDD